MGVVLKVLLLNPPVAHHVKSFRSRKLGLGIEGSFPPLGLLYIAAYLRANSAHSVEVVDCVVDQLDQLGIQRLVRSVAPDVVGIGATTYTFYDVLETATSVKMVDARIHVCVGGPHTTWFADETMVHPEIDSLVLGDGEVVFHALVDRVSIGEPLSGIPGLVFRDGAGTVVSNQGRGRVDDLDSLPSPAFDLVDYNRYRSTVGVDAPMASIVTTRGCPFNCTFCQSG